MDRIEAIVVGAGVVGLAIARALAQSGREVLVLEAENAIGTQTSARNSGVIHAGIYYHPGGLKAKLCVKGRDMLYAYCVEKGVPHHRCGKLLVATTENEIKNLHEWKDIAGQNGVHSLRMITPAEARAMEPEVFCVAAVHSPDTGIIDVHEYMNALQGDLEAAGGQVVLNAPVTGGAVVSEGFVLQVGGESPMEIGCDILINSAGLGAQNLSHKISGIEPSTIPPQVLAKGNYFSITGKQPFKMLVYPMPTLGSSGLHATCDLAGRVRFGPDVEWIEKIDYAVDPARAAKFEESVQRYWPNMPKGQMVPDYSGIRPKVAKGSPHDTDFIIQDKSTHGVKNLVALYGIESPGLTSSLAIAEEVISRL